MKKYYNEEGKAFVKTGEFRKPKEGEFYLYYNPSGSAKVEKANGMYVFAFNYHIVRELLPFEEPIDNVNHPAHYNTGSIEVINYIEDKLSEDALEGYFVGNIIKYVSRYKSKCGIEDLKKAKWYLDRMIQNMELSENGCCSEDQGDNW